MRVMSLNIGKPRLLVHDGQNYTSAINKRAVDHAVALTVTGLDGDDVANHEAHGGPEQALCFYASESYGPVGEFLGVELAVPSFGENITSEGMAENEVCIGDVYRIGSAGVVVQVSKPRQPCSKLARKHNRSDLPGFIHYTGFSGFYVRVLNVGTIAPGDEIELVERKNPDLSVADTMRAMFDPEAPRELLERLAACAELSPGWRQQMANRLLK